MTPAADRPAKPIKRIALAILRRDGKFLLQLRPGGGAFGGLWEFPGGKIEPGESPEEAAEREVLEELNCSVRAERLLGTASHDYEDFSVELYVVLCFLPASSVPVPLAAAEVRWIDLRSLGALPIPEANHKLLPLLATNL